MRRSRAETEYRRPLGEERPLLGEERFELREIEHRRIHFHLAEVGIDRAGEPQRRRQRVLHVDAAVHVVVVRARERIAGRNAVRQIGARHAVRNDFERSLGMDALDSGEVCETRHGSGLPFRCVDQPVHLFVRRRAAREIDSPDLIRPIGKPKLRIRDLDLGGPAAVGDLRRRLPHRIPAPIVVDVVVQIHVDLHVRRVDPEARAGEAVVLRVDVDAEPVGLEIVVAAAEESGDRLGVVELRRDVNGVVVVGHFHRRLLRGGLSVVGIVLREAGDLRRFLPDFVGEVAVDDWRLRCAHGADGEGGGRGSAGGEQRCGECDCEGTGANDLHLFLTARSELACTFGCVRRVQVRKVG